MMKEKMTYRLLKKYSKNGNNSECFLIEEKGRLFFLKFTSNREKWIKCDYTPKKYKVNPQKYSCLSKETYKHVYKYEFIRGKQLDETEVNDLLFRRIIEMFCYFFTNGFFVWDSHLGNIIVSKSTKPYFVDFGGIAKKPFKSTFYVFSFSCRSFPDDYAINRNTEEFIIYRLAYDIQKNCVLRLSTLYSRIMGKMLTKNPSERYSCFTDILKQMM